MLIVNADDMGASPSTTDPVVEGFEAGAITSTTAMVWMPDSDRAGAIARARGLPVGLHLNFTLPFAADAVPDAVRRRQLELTRSFDPDSWLRRDDRGAAATLIAAGIADQLDRFRDQFGEPTHIDGHHHVHLHPAVLGQLPRSLAIRPPLQGSPRAPLGQRWLLRRHRGAAACVAFGHVHPALGGDGMGRLDSARRLALEVMVHPAVPAERQALLSAEWRDALADLPLGSYRDLNR
jgi:hypothetical protein